MDASTITGVDTSIILERKIMNYKLSNTCAIFTDEAIAKLKKNTTVINEEHKKFIIFSDP